MPQLFKNYFKSLYLARNFNLMLKNLPKTLNLISSIPINSTEKQIFFNPLFRHSQKNSYLGFLQNTPKRISVLEKAGIPKSERNQYIFDDYISLPIGDPSVTVVNKDGTLAHLKAPNYDAPPAFRYEGTRVDDGQLYWKDGILYKRGRKNLYITNNNFLSERPKVQSLKRKPNAGSDASRTVTVRRMDNGTDLIDISDLLNEYGNSLPDILNVDASIFRDNDWFHTFQLFYTNLGYNVSNVKPINILKIIEDNYKQLSAGSTGKLKERVFWNGTPDRFKIIGDAPNNYSLQLVREGIPETFKHGPKIGAVRTSPSDNHGIYFGTLPFNLYAYPTASLTNNGTLVNLFHAWDMNRIPEGFMTSERLPIGRADMLPYMINDIGTIFKLLPEGLKGRVPKNTILYTDSFKGNIPYDYLTGHVDEITVGIGTPIKSLFPHPKAFIRNTDGTTSLVRNWLDLRVHYKKGGKLYDKSNK